MPHHPVRSEAESPHFRVCHEQFDLRTDEPLQFIDLSELVAERVRRSRIGSGTVNVQSRHTTTAIVINENEPLLIEDLKELLDAWAPRTARYRHDDLSARQPPFLLAERVNGHAHARAVLLGSSETLNIVNGQVQLGRWQRILLVELDGCQKRSVSITVMGVAAGAGPRSAAPQPIPEAKPRGLP
jgi:secondary thiamine-phosphate synthase enzyme